LPDHGEAFLKKKKSIRRQLALASCALMAGSLANADILDNESNAAAYPDPQTASADIGGLFYRENGGRVSANEGVFNIRSAEDNGDNYTLSITYDVLSGGSPNGALPSHSPQTFSSPSGNSLTPPGNTPPPTPQTCTTASGITYTCGTTPPKNTLYTVAPGDLPLDKSFHDQREALDFSWETPVSRDSRVAMGAAYSHELDFQSVSVNSKVTSDFNDKNTTLFAGLNLEHDISHPVGGTPVPLSDYSLFLKGGNESRNVLGYAAGLTQVLARRWLTQLSLSAEVARGYQNDPYKIVSGLDSSGNTVGYIYENRPAYRFRRSLYWENRFALPRDTVAVSARLTRDSWGSVSRTADIRYRFELGDGKFIEPHYRWYHQTRADFYRLYALQGDPYLSDVSADPRLGEFTAQTIGLKYGVILDKDVELGLRAERYAQHGVVSQPVLPNLQGLDLYPRFKAAIITADLQFKF
jgi:hypothetical protein